MATVRDKILCVLASYDTLRVTLSPDFLVYLVGYENVQTKSYRGPFKSLRDEGII
jgi:hypothetical protein